MQFWIKIQKSDKVVELKDPSFIQKAINVGKLTSDDLLGKSPDGPWSRLDQIRGLRFPTEQSDGNNTLVVSGKPSLVPTFSGIFRKGAKSLQKVSKSARNAFDNVIAETQRVVDDKDRITITESAKLGRAADRVDWVIPDPNVAPVHAELQVKNGQLCIADMKSRYGTFVNGNRLPPNTFHELNDDDAFQIGGATFTVSGTTIISATRTDHAHLECINLTRVVNTEEGGSKVILSNVTLSIPPKSFVVFIGPSGSGKSTLLNALNGRATATSGTVLLNKENLYENYNRLRSRIANVPQKDVLHFDLPLRDSLSYTAGLKLPHDMNRSEKEAAIDRAISEVGMEVLQSEAMQKYSGGQVKRASVAHEILSNPSLVCVDEATSGLDEHSDREIMGLMRDIADGGKTILCITHNLGNVLEFCDTLVIMAEGGFLAFIGSPNEAIKYFGIDNLSDLYLRLKDKPGQVWGDEWTLHHSLESASGELNKNSDRGQVAIQRESISSLQHVGFMLRHGAVILQRIRALALRDTTSLAVMLLQPALVFLVIWMLFGSMDADVPGQATVGFLLVISAFWFGCSNSAKEIVKESGVFQKERHAGLNAVGYLGAKAVWLVAMTLIQAIGLFFCTKVATGLDIPIFEGVVLLSGISFCGVALGLYISAFAKNTDVAVSAVPLAIIPQVVLGGHLMAPDGLAEIVSWLVIPCYWAYGILCDSFVNSEYSGLVSGNLYSAENVIVSLGVVLITSLILLTLSAFKLSGIKVGGELMKLGDVRK